MIIIIKHCILFFRVVKDKKTALYGYLLNAEHIADNITIFRAIKPFLFPYNFSDQKCPDVNSNYPEVKKSDLFS